MISYTASIKSKKEYEKVNKYCEAHDMYIRSYDNTAHGLITSKDLGVTFFIDEIENKLADISFTANAKGSPSLDNTYNSVYRALNATFKDKLKAVKFWD